jgi:hypothetical protein
VYTHSSHKLNRLWVQPESCAYATIVLVATRLLLAFLNQVAVDGTGTCRVDNVKGVAGNNLECWRE